jgi:hypothetical protein
MIATLTTSLKKPWSPGPRKHLRSYGNCSSVCNFKTKKMPNKFARDPSFQGARCWKKEFPKNPDQISTHMKWFPELGNRSITVQNRPETTSQIGYTHHCRHQAAAVMENVKFVGNLQSHMQQRMSCFLVRVCKYAWELVGTVKFWGTSRIWGPSIRTTTFHKNWDLGWKSSGSKAVAEINW